MELNMLVLTLMLDANDYEIVVKAEKKLNYLETMLPTSPLDGVAEDACNVYAKFSNEQLEELKTMFQQQLDQELFETVKAFHACKQETIPELHAMLKLAEKGVVHSASKALIAPDVMTTRCVEISSILFPVKSTSHLLFSCLVARQVKSKVARWWELDDPILHS
ncbi:hypothetical protein Tco_0702213 [Tanacetum coccineum]|uniref:Uncharacterized protein n=1 Tax=Tanacetum coccineum TaxID=301880 RepID=A0ABQ4XX57_9ASTR